MNLNNDLAKELLKDLQKLCHRINPGVGPWSKSDYICEFCGECPETNNDEIFHAKDCRGIKYLTALENGLSEWPDSNDEQFLAQCEYLAEKRKAKKR